MVMREKQYFETFTRNGAKGSILYYWQGLTDTLKIDNDFSRKLSGDEKDHEFQPEILFTERHQIKDCLQSEWEEP